MQLSVFMLTAISYVVNVFMWTLTGISYVVSVVSRYMIDPPKKALECIKMYFQESSRHSWLQGGIWSETMYRIYVLCWFRLRKGILIL